MKSGYNITPLGKLPASWELKKFDEVVNLNEDSLSTSTPPHYSFMYIDLTSVKNGKIDFPLETISFSESPSRARRVIKKGDIIMATVRPNLLGYAYINFDATDYICSTGFAVITPGPQMDGRYLYQSLYSNLIQSQILKLLVGSNYPAVNSSDVANLKIPIPTLLEQCKIADILSTVDEKIEAIDQRIAHTQELKKGLMQRLLTKGIGHTRFKDSPLGKIPESWEVVKLGKVTEIIMGQSPQGNSYNKKGIGVPMLNGPTEFTDKYPNPIQFTSNPTKLCKSGDILFCVRGSTTGKMNLANKEYCIGRGLAAIRGIEKSDTSFIFYVLQNLAKEVIRRAKDMGSTFPNVNSVELNKYPLGFPALAEQIGIAKILNAVDEKLEVLQEKKQEYQQLKKGLMQQLLTGKIRVVID